MRTHQRNARNEKHVQRTWSEWMVTMAQPSLHLTVTAVFHPCVAGTHQSRRIWRTAPVNVVVNKRSQERQWKLLLYPTIAPTFELLPIGEVGPVGSGQDGVLVELEDALKEGVYTPDASITAPGLCSGLSNETLVVGG
jgi:hypothetical protein